jgi:phytoene/squalene synthetase
VDAEAVRDLLADAQRLADELPAETFVCVLAIALAAAAAVLRVRPLCATTHSICSRTVGSDPS